MNIWPILFLCFVGCAQSSPDTTERPRHEILRLSLSDIMNESELAGVAFRLEVVDFERVCVEENSFTPISTSRTPADHDCFMSFVEGDGYVNKVLISILSDIIESGDCDRSITPYTYSHEDGPVNTLYVPGYKHIIFYGPTSGWILMPISDAAADRVLDGDFCQLQE